MALDTLAALQASVTKTASFNSASYNLYGGTPKRGLYAVIDYSAAANASGANSVTFSIEESSDNSNFFIAASAAEDILNLTTTALAGRIWLPFNTNKQYVRLVATFAGAGGSPTITYAAWIGISAP